MIKLSKTPLIIGCAGICNSGKNTFCDLLEEYLTEKYKLNIKQLSFASSLREETEDFLREKFRLDVWTQDRAEKDKFRDFFTIYSDMKRKATNGTYFFDAVKEEIKYCSSVFPFDIYLLSDARFKEYEYDETDFIKENGILVHVTKFRINKDVFIRQYPLPPNKFEAENDPKIKEMANYKFEWPEVGDGELNKLYPYVVNFVNWMEKEGYLKVC